MGGGGLENRGRAREPRAVRACGVSLCAGESRPSGAERRLRAFISIHVVCLAERVREDREKCDEAPGEKIVSYGIDFPCCRKTAGTFYYLVPNLPCGPCTSRRLDWLAEPARHSSRLSPPFIALLIFFRPLLAPLRPMLFPPSP